MLRKFAVTNFMGFAQEIVFDLSDTKRYEFNTNCIRNGIVNSSIVYGHNGSGKSNLGLAIFDIIAHLTDKNREERYYNNYLCADGDSGLAVFRYEFLVNELVVYYEYKKKNYSELVFEKLLIGNNLVLFFDRTKQNHFQVSLSGAETLNTTLNDSKLSAVKFVKNNTVLEQNEINAAFIAFIEFAERMLFFRSLDHRMYLGLENGIHTIASDIIERGNISDFDRFLNDAKIQCHLGVLGEKESKTLAFRFGNKLIGFHDIASTGTNVLALFYFWFQRIKAKQVSFLFIDEFDAFYHHELSAMIVEILKESGVQFVLTTHNTSIISNDLLRPDCYFLLNKGVITSLANCSEKELREAHNIEKMYKAGAFNVE